MLGTTGQLPAQGQVNLSDSFEENPFLEKGWGRTIAKPFPTFTTSRPSPVPLRRPAGPKHCNQRKIQRWHEDRHRFPPYQYMECHCVVNAQGRLRPPSVCEREVILGFPPNYTMQCMSKSLHGSLEHEDCRLTLLGNSWAVRGRRLAAQSAASATWHH